MTEPAPLLLSCGDVVLRAAGPAHDDLLVALMPQDFDHDPTFPLVDGRPLPEHRAVWMREWLRAFREPEQPADRALVFVVEHGGEPVGLQTLEGERFAEARAVETTSFLVPRARGQRLGVAMRTAVLALAFDHLGAVRATSSARPDNVASHRVTERVGYQFVERTAPVVAGNPRPIDTYELTVARWRELDHLQMRVSGTVPTWTTGA